MCITDEPCMKCQGKGQHHDKNASIQECFTCQGDGKKREWYRFEDFVKRVAEHLSGVNYDTLLKRRK